METRRQRRRKQELEMQQGVWTLEELHFCLSAVSAARGKLSNLVIAQDVTEPYKRARARTSPPTPPLHTPTGETRFKSES